VVIEGEVVPNERTEEGPHGESTGFYGQNLAAFVIKVKAITHRKDPLTYGLICQRVEAYPRQLLRSGSMQSRLIERTGKTNIREVYFPEVGRRGMLIVSADIQHKEEPREIMEAIMDSSRTSSENGVRGGNSLSVLSEPITELPDLIGTQMKDSSASCGLLAAPVRCTIPGSSAILRTTAGSPD